MQIEVKYLKTEPYFIHKGYRTLVVTANEIVYINFKNNSSKNFKINSQRYKKIYNQYKFYTFISILTQGAYING